MTKPMDTESTSTLMVLNSKENGSKTNKKAKVLKHGPMELDMRETIN